MVNGTPSYVLLMDPSMDPSLIWFLEIHATHSDSVPQAHPTPFLQSYLQNTRLTNGMWSYSVCRIKKKLLRENNEKKKDSYWLIHT